LSNSPLLAETLSRGAPKIAERFAGQESTAMIEWLYESALSRDPNETERKIAVELLGPSPTPDDVQDLVWLVIMLPEFQLIR
jgi:hypothetical protein